MTQIIFTTRRSVRGRSNKEAPRWQTDANKRLNDDNNPTSPLSHCLGQEYLGMIEFLVVSCVCNTTLPPLHIKKTRPIGQDRSAN